MDRESNLQMEKLEELIQGIEREASAELRKKTQDLIRLLMEFHREAILRIMSLAGASAQVLATDELVSSIFILHNMHPVCLRDRVESALERVRPILAKHHGNVILVSEKEGTIKLRLEGSCRGCPSSIQTLRGAVEQEILASAPDVFKIEVEGLDLIQPQPQHTSCPPKEQES